MQEGYLNVEEARQALKISRLTLYRWIKAGKIPASKVGSTYRIKKQDIEDYLSGKLVAKASVNTTIAPSRGPLIVTARDIELWATNNRMAEEQLPELVSRLVQATREETGLTELHLPFGDSIGQPGWDGKTETTRGNLYVPAGTSAWEMGIGDPQTKATSDHTKRTAEPLNVKPDQTTFTFVTPRVWDDSDNWKTRKKSSGWKNIKVIDANDLESWLEIAPAVKYWFLGILSRSVDGVQDIESFWEAWSTETNPPISVGLVLSGRVEDKEQLQQKILDPARTVVTVAAESRSEALAFIAASILNLPDDQSGELLSSTLVIENQLAWDSAAKHPTPLVLVAHFDDPQRVGKAVSAGHKVIIPVDKAIPTDDDTKVIARPKKEDILKELEAIGVPKAQRASLAAIGRHSLLSLWRKLALTSAIKHPAWAVNETVLVPALLIGKWDDSNEADRAVLSQLSGRTYEEFILSLEELYAQPDSPVGRVGNKWYVASKDDVWSILYSKVTAKHIADFIKVAVDVLSEHDPALDLELDKRWMANIYGKKLANSREIRESVADTLALISARYTNKEIGKVDGSTIAATIVRDLLAKAQADTSGHLWASLDGVMPLLAEAAPNEFLDALDSGLKGVKPTLAFIFQDSEDNGPFGSHSSHTGFLWALENIAWSPTYLARASNSLCKLHEIDPGGKLSNRPLGSLKDIFLSWHPQTLANLEQRMDVLKGILQKHPETGWELLLGVLPDSHGFTTGSHKPKWQEWSSDNDSISYSELFQTVDAVSALLLANVGSDAIRWCALVEHYPNLSPDYQKKISQELTAMNVDKFSPEDRLKIWDALRHFVYQHRRFAGAKWAMKKDQVDLLVTALDKFEPTDLEDKYTWLFGHNVDLPIPDDEDYEGYELKIKDARLSAVKDIYKVQGLAGLYEISKKANVPHFLGVALGQAGVLNKADQKSLLTHLDDKDQIAQFTRGYVAGVFYPENWQWAKEVIATIKDATLLASFLVVLPNSSETWKLLEAEDSELQKLYWEKCSTLGLGKNEEFVYSAQKLLEAGRPYDAVEVLGVYIDQADHSPTVEIVMSSLEAAVQTSPERTDMTMFRYYVTKLLEFLDKQAEVDESRLAQLEWQLLPLLKDDRKPKVLHKELATNPKFFAEVVGWVYRARGAEKKKLSKEQETRARLGNELLDTWSTIPGHKNGATDQKKLDAWIDKARALLAKSDRAIVGDHVIGKMLGTCDPDPDGMWPSLAVRNLLERLESPEIEESIRTAIYNSRGFTSRAIGEGGNQERGLAKKYDDLAHRAQIKWPRTAYLLLRSAETWRREAERHDNEAVEDELE